MIRPIFIMLVGLPGSGKTTWRKNFLNEVNGDLSFNNFTVVSLDDEVEAVAHSKNLTYDDVWVDSVKMCEGLVKTKFENALKDQANIIHDMTNLNEKSRANKLRLVPDYYIKTAVVFVNPDDEEWKRRLNGRSGKTIPKHVLDSMLESYKYPQMKEGFDMIQYVGQDIPFCFDKFLNNFSIFRG